MFKKITPTWLWIFISVFIIGLVLYMALWINLGVIDKHEWNEAIQEYSYDMPIKPGAFSFGYPATTLFIPGAAFVHLGYESFQGLNYTLAIFMAFFAGCNAVMLYFLRPQKLWWVSGTAMLLFSVFPIRSTPPSALVVLPIVFMVLCALYVYEHREKKNTQALIAFVLASSFSMATRIDITVLFLVILSCWLWPILRNRLWLVLGAIAVVSYIFIPFVWASPLSYAHALYEKVHIHARDMASNQSTGAILRETPFGIVSFLAGIVLLTLRRDLLPVPKKFLGYLFILTVIIWSVFHLSHYHPNWYFFPLFAVWEVFLPLLIGGLFMGYVPRVKTPWLTTRRVSGGVVILIVAAQVWLLVQQFILLFVYHI